MKELSPSSKPDDIDLVGGAADVLFDHDDNGNVTLIDDAVGVGYDLLLSYGPDDRLEQVDLDGSWQWDFSPSYAGPPYRIAKSMGSGDEDWIDLHYDAGLQLLGRFDWQDDGATELRRRQYIWVGNHLLGFWDDDDAEPYFTVTDQVGLPFQSFKWDGSSVWAPEILPFGGIETPDATGKDPELRYPGQVDVGMDWMMVNGWRMYSGELGAYLQPDPLRLKGGQINIFGYAANSPLVVVDSMGLEILVCSRKTFLPAGNHSYLWDDRTNHNGLRACGSNGAFGRGDPAVGSMEELGPDFDFCYIVPDSAGREDEIMGCCQETANDGLWFPGLNDCTNAAEDCVRGSGLDFPGSPGGRFGPPECSENEPLCLIPLNPDFDRPF